MKLVYTALQIVVHNETVIIVNSFCLLFRTGKFKTVSQMFMIIFLILDLPGHTAVMIETVLIYLALILTVVSLIDYIAKNKEVLTKGGM